jgi:hypothetical protein
MKIIIWKGIIYNSLEYFKLKREKDTFIVKSKIIGTYEDKMYAVAYNVLIDNEWKVQNFKIEYEVNNIKKKIIGEKINNKWKMNGVINPSYTDFDFIDISLTPFTNTLPIRNLNLEIGQEQEVNVIYINILDNYVKPVKQKYRKISDRTYKYENVPNDFEADISVDELGLVIFYPLLFERLIDNKAVST